MKWTDGERKQLNTALTRLENALDKLRTIKINRFSN